MSAAILAAAPYSEAEEATWNLTGMVGYTNALDELLDALGLSDVSTHEWTVPRAQRRLLSCCMDGFTESAIRHFLPHRAHDLIPDTVAGLLEAGLLQADDPGSADRGYRLTQAGRYLAIDLRGDRPSDGPVLVFPKYHLN